MRRHPAVDEGDLSWMRQAVVGRDSCAAAATAAGLPEAFVAAAPAPPPRGRGRAGRASEPAGGVRRGGDRGGLARPRGRGDPRRRAGGLRAGARRGRPRIARSQDGAPGERGPPPASTVAYELADTQGPPQRPVFTSRVRVGGDVLGEGSGPSKQASEQAAAGQALARLTEESVMLTRLTVRGFKSFADATTLHLGPGVNVVVGPNGSGKSNLAEAVVWALGEQRAGRLRAGGMADVLYSGGDRRPGAPFAEVSLVLGGGEADGRRARRGRGEPAAHAGGRRGLPAQLRRLPSARRAGGARLPRPRPRRPGRDPPGTGRGPLHQHPRRAPGDGRCGRRRRRGKAPPPPRRAEAREGRRPPRARARHRRRGALARPRAGSPGARRRACRGPRRRDRPGPPGRRRGACPGRRRRARPRRGARPSGCGPSRVVDAQALEEARAARSRAAQTRAEAAGAASAAQDLASGLRTAADRTAGRAELAAERVAAAEAEAAERARRRRAAADLLESLAEAAATTAAAARGRGPRRPPTPPRPPRPPPTRPTPRRARSTAASRTPPPPSRRPCSRPSARPPRPRAGSRTPGRAARRGPERLRALEADAGEAGALARAERRDEISSGRAVRWAERHRRAELAEADAAAARGVADVRLREARVAARALAPADGRSGGARGLGEGLTVEEGAEHAVAAALGMLAEAVPAPSVAEARAALEAGADCAVVPGPRARRRRGLPGGRRVLDLVVSCADEARPHLERLLADAWLVDDLDAVPAGHARRDGHPGGAGASPRRRAWCSAPRAPGRAGRCTAVPRRRSRAAAAAVRSPPREAEAAAAALAAASAPPPRRRSLRRARGRALATVRARAGGRAARAAQAARGGRAPRVPSSRPGGRARGGGATRRAGTAGADRASQAAATARAAADAASAELRTRAGRRRRRAGGSRRRARRGGRDRRARLARPVRGRRSRTWSTTSSRRRARRGRWRTPPARWPRRPSTPAASRRRPTPAPATSMPASRRGTGPWRRASASSRRAPAGPTRPRSRRPSPASGRPRPARRRRTTRRCPTPRRPRRCLADLERRREGIGAVNPLAAVEREELSTRESEMIAQIDDLESTAEALRGSPGGARRRGRRGLRLAVRRLPRPLHGGLRPALPGRGGAAAGRRRRGWRGGDRGRGRPGGQAPALAGADVGRRAVAGGPRLLPGPRDGAPGAVLPARRGRGGPRRRQPAALPRRGAAPVRADAVPAHHPPAADGGDRRHHLRRDDGRRGRLAGHRPAPARATSRAPRGRTSGGRSTPSRAGARRERGDDRADREAWAELLGLAPPAERGRRAASPRADGAAAGEPEPPRQAISPQLAGIYAGKLVTAESWDDLEEALIAADCGMDASLVARRRRCVRRPPRGASPPAPTSPSR